MKKETKKKTKKQKKVISSNEKSELEPSKGDPGEPKIEEEKETSELEEEIKDAENSLGKNQFQEFIQQSSTGITQPTESFSPVLKRVETPQQEPLEQNVASTQLSIGEAEDTTQTKYTPAKQSEDYTVESKKGDETYTESGKIDEDLIVRQPASINIETAGRDLHPQLREVTPVTLESQELRKPQGTLEEKYIQPEKIDTEKVGRETPGKIKEYKIK